MKAIMLMFDSLNRRFLEPYGCEETITPNFKRLAEHTVQFGNSYAGSLPCIPARRELHSGRYNFLHRSWGPLEPFDESMHRTAIKEKKDFPLVKTFDKGMEFLEKNAEKDAWFLQIESFAPHEPFMASEDFKRLYPGTELTKRFEWPDYAPVSQSLEEIEQIRHAYFASLSMCDEQLGRVLDFMDEHQLWEDTMLIVNTDHGYMLGEHGYWAKNYMPCYDEIVHTPLFMWDPRYAMCRGITRDSLVQTIDIPVTVLEFFGIEPGIHMQGKSIVSVIERDERIHDYVLFGMFGAHICCTDGRYVYMRQPRDFAVTLCEYTLMPTHMMHFFSLDELKTMKWYEGFSFTNGVPVMQIEAEPDMRCIEKGEYLYDLRNDPGQHSPIQSEQVRQNMENLMRQLLLESDAPDSLLKRFGFINE